MRDVVLRVEGMKCDGCVASVTEALERVHGVESAEVSLTEARARVTVGEGVTEDDLVQAVTSAGYEASSGA
jgi:copper chaperone CopZ